MFRKKSNFVFGQNNFYFRCPYKNVKLICGAPMSNVVLSKHDTIGDVGNVPATGI